MRKILALLALWLPLTPPAARAGGFLIYEHGAASTGMANARTALSGDPSSVYFNPAAITELDGLQLQLGTTLILPYIHYEPTPTENPRSYTSYQDGHYVQLPVNDGENPADAVVKLFTPIHLYATWNLREVGLSLGFGLNNPFGLGTYWPADWDGRFIATETEIKTFFNQPTLAADLTRWVDGLSGVKLSLAFGYDFVYGTARLGRRIDLRAAESLSLGTIMGAEGALRLTGSGTGQGWNTALYFELPGVFSFGASLRSPVALGFSGPAKFMLDADARAAAELMGLEVPESTNGHVTINLPWTLNLGVALLAVDRLRLAADVYLAFFSSYHQLKLQFDCVGDGTCSETLQPDPIEKNWHISVQVSAGAEYLLVESFTLRAGWGVVTSPVPAETYDPSLPDGTRQLFAAGCGWRVGWFALEAGYLVSFWSGRKDNLVGAGDYLNPEGLAGGKYSTVSHLLALSLSAHF